MWFCLFAAWASPAEDALKEALSAHVSDKAQVDSLLVEADAEVKRVTSALRDQGGTQGLGERLFAQMTESLREKASRPTPLTLDAKTISRTVIGYEGFKLERYVTSGVFPKRYFGYLDGRAETAAHEIEAMHAARAAAAAANRWAEQNGRPVRITEAEVLVTFLAEGGALWLGERGPFHPVMDVGLDDIALGHRDQPGLLTALDEASGSDLMGMVAWWDGVGPLPKPSALPDSERWLRRDHGKGDDRKEGPFPYLTHAMTLKETVVGTALMYVWEKEIAQSKLLEGGHRGIMERPLDEQFVISSLIYNSGLLHDPIRWKQILTFQTGQWLYDRSEKNKATRPTLALLPPPRQLSAFLSTGRYEQQNTSWVAVYHVLQRYGAFAALYRFTDAFLPDGSLRAIPSPPEPPAKVEPQGAESPASAEPEARSGCCSVLGGSATLSVAWPMLFSRRARQ